MKKIRFSIDINAPQIDVWQAVIQDNAYRQWTEVFAVGSHFVGEWKTGSKMQFLGPDEQGNLGGMSSIIAVFTPHECISIKHVGFVKNGVEDTESDQVKAWEGAHENYTFIPIANGTRFEIEMDTIPEYEGYFNDTWPKALTRLKEVAEGAPISTLTVQTRINAPMERVWNAFTQPEHITKWCFATPEWEAPLAENDLQVGGRFKTHMRAKDKSVGFDFEGVYTAIHPHALIDYHMADGRTVSVQFVALPDGIKVTQTFTPESSNPIEMQRAGWQAILDNFKHYVQG